MAASNAPSSLKKKGVSGVMSELTSRNPAMSAHDVTIVL